MPYAWLGSSKKGVWASVDKQACGGQTGRSAPAGPDSLLGLCFRHVACDGLLRFRRAGDQVKVVAVDVDCLDAAPDNLEGERLRRFPGFRVVDEALVVAMMQLRRADER